MTCKYNERLFIDNVTVCYNLTLMKWLKCVCYGSSKCLSHLYIHFGLSPNSMWLMWRLLLFFFPLEYQALNKCVGCLPGQKDVDEAIHSITDASQILDQGEFPHSSKSYGWVVSHDLWSVIGSHYKLGIAIMISLQTTAARAELCCSKPQWRVSRCRVIGTQPNTTRRLVSYLWYSIWRLAGSKHGNGWTDQGNYLQLWSHDLSMFVGSNR